MAFVTELQSDNFYTRRRVEATELKVEATELRDKFRVYKLLTFQYYFNKVVRLYEADVFLPRFGVASTNNFLKEPILVHRVTSPHILSTYYELGTFQKF